jgi:hypothetical protein
MHYRHNIDPSVDVMVCRDILNKKLDIVYRPMSILHGFPCSIVIAAAINVFV